MTRGRGRGATGGRLVAAVLGCAVLALPAVAGAHVERSSYWPDPAVDKSVETGAGGAVPKARSLGSALKSAPPGQTRVVCQDDSLALAEAAIRQARRDGYDIRPSDHRNLKARGARRLLDLNRAFARRCEFDEIQPAVNASGNNDRVVVMPGTYKEPTARSAPTQDPECAKYKITNERGNTGAVSYAYQYHCQNDQNLIAVQGQRPGAGTDPEPPREDRRGIPNTGRCIRCNLQLEGSGPSADDVIVEAGRAASGNAGPADPVKDVGIRVDRADGFVLRNVTVRHAAEHAIYVLETDGYLLDRFKTFYAREYGVLTFVEDHGLIQNCEAAGSGDSGLYPGAGAETGAQREPGTKFRYSQRIRFCDSHHNASGYSGTDGNATRVDHNNFYDNALGFTTDVFTAPGHPGFPQDSALVEHNNFYSNNFNPYAEGSDVDPSVPVPVGTGLWIAGGNDNVIRNNRFWNNWRRGVMLFGVPDATVCGPAIGTPVTGCDPAQLSTSYRNSFYGNTMGVSPGGKTKPNGLDFWWDSFPGNTGNCWYGNEAAPGRSITSSPAGLPRCAGGKDPGSSIGTSAPANESELLGCLGALTLSGYNADLCPWFETPERPARSAAAADERRRAANRAPVLGGAEGLSTVCRLYGDLGDERCTGGSLPARP